MSEQDRSSEGEPERQHVVRVSRRRAKLTAAPGTQPEPHIDEADPTPAVSSGGPNDERMRRDVPPHY
ncbi:hypothetical protein [Microbacterium gorillae]|uniref:hypothetical protein n=1 Tax=Microbacterium gorillae TaxID=1231063 RepID=UPI00058B26B5|nr:hypothetical protein [Microbacterium gorillae]